MILRSTAILILLVSLPGAPSDVRLERARRDYAAALRDEPAARDVSRAVERLWDAYDRAIRDADGKPARAALVLARDALLAETLPRAPAPDRFTLRRDDTPDLTQTDPRAGLPRGGRDSCGPVAMSDALLALAASGRPTLVPDAPDALAAHAALARTLADAEHMGTGTSGTGVASMLRGAARYARSRGLEVVRAHALGWRPVSRGWRPREEEPLLDAIRRAHVAGAAVCLDVGWYRAGSSEETSVRFGGHWVALAGFGVDAAGRTAPDVLILRDPSPRGGTRPAFHHARVLVARAGRLEGSYRGLPRPAAGVPRITEGLPFHRKAARCYVDGVVVLDVRPR